VRTSTTSSMSPCRLPDAASDRRTSIVQQPSLVVSINGSKWLRRSSKVDFVALDVDNRERADSLARTVCAQPSVNHGFVAVI
jgi:hypothetical protein